MASNATAMGQLQERLDATDANIEGVKMNIDHLNDRLTSTTDQGER